MGPGALRAPRHRVFAERGVGTWGAVTQRQGREGSFVSASGGGGELTYR